MFCPVCRKTTKARHLFYRGDRYPFCSECTPRHDGFWSCNCTDCWLWRIENTRQQRPVSREQVEQAIRDALPQSPRWHGIQKITDSIMEALDA